MDKLKVSGFSTILDVFYSDTSELSLTSEELIQILRGDITNIENEEDKNILISIIKDLELGNHSILGEQEKEYLRVNNQSGYSQYLIFRWKLKEYPKLRKVAAFPLYLLIEPTPICNLKCTMCFQMDDQTFLSKDYMGFIEMDLFKRVIDEAHEGGTKAITLASRGEPTLHPQFGEMLDYCSGKFHEIKVNTNATKLNEDLIHTILKNNVNHLVFSVDSYTKEDYKIIRGFDKFDEIVSNIELFNKIRKKTYPNSRVLTRVQGVKVNEEMNSSEFYNYWEDYADSVALQDTIFRWDIYNNKINKHSESCLPIWDRMYIWYDGNCSPCDQDYKGLLSLGNIKNNSLAEMWNGERISKMRKDHISGNRNNHFPCDRCPV